MKRPYRVEVGHVSWNRQLEWNPWGTYSTLERAEAAADKARADPYCKAQRWKFRVLIPLKRASPQQGDEP